MSYTWVQQDENKRYLLIIHDAVVVGHVEWDEAQQQYQAVYRGWQVGSSVDQGEARSILEKAENKLRSILEKAENKLRSADRETARSKWLVTFGESEQQAGRRLHLEAEDVMRIGACILVADGVRVELDEEIDAVEKLPR